MERPALDAITGSRSAKLSRRQLLAGLGVAASPGILAAQERRFVPTSGLEPEQDLTGTYTTANVPDPPGIVKAQKLSHMMIRCANFARAERFYRRLFGFPPLQLWEYHPGRPAIMGFLLPTGEFIGFIESEAGGLGASGFIDHIGVECDPFDAAQIAKEIEPIGVKRSGYDREYGIIRDPDGIGIQLVPRRQPLSASAFKNASMIGGAEATPQAAVSGPKDLKPLTYSAEESPGGISKALAIDHVNLFVRYLARTEAFYRRLFGFPPLQLWGYPVAHPAVMGFGLPSDQYISFLQSEGNFTPSGQVLQFPSGHVDHFAFGCDKVDTARMAKEIEPLGVKRTQYDHDLGIIRDPDGIGFQMLVRG